MKNRFFVISIITMLTMVLLAGFAFSQSQTQPSSQPNQGINECKELYWFDNQTRECGLKSFCGAYMYQGLQTFKTKEECEKALDETETVLPGGTPESTNTSEMKCKELYWFDSTSKACGLKQFCGEYMYQGLRTFEEKEECQKALDEFLGATSENTPGSEGESHVINNVTVSTSSSEGNQVGEANGTTSTVYSLGACPSTIPEVCPEEKEPVCATISHFSFNGGYKKYKKTFDNWCKACRASTRTDLVVNYVKGECKQWSPECPFVSKPEPESCPNGKITAVYKEFNGKKCIAGYRCITPTNPSEVLPVFIYSENNASARTTKTFRLYKSGAMSETITSQQTGSAIGIISAKRLKGKISPEEALEFLKKLEELGFFEIKYLKDCRAGATSEQPSSNETNNTNTPGSIGIISCPAGAANHTIYARFNKENKLHWYNGLTSEPEAIAYALERVKEFEKLMDENPFNSNIFVQLGEAFNLQIGQRAIVRETSLKIRLERIEGGTATVSLKPPFKPLLEKETSAEEKGNKNTTPGNTGAEQVMLSRWIKLKPGESKNIYGHTIKLNSLLTPKCSEETLANGNTVTKCIGAKPIANLTITKAEEPHNEIKAWLGKKFEIAQGQTARLLDKQNNPAMTMSLERINIPSDCSVGPCKVDEKTGIKVCPMIWCDERPVAKILWKPISEPGKLVPMMMRMLAIRKGETKISGNFRFYFADLIDNKAVFVVTQMGGGEEVQLVKTGKPFKLKEKETALIEDKDIFLTLIRVGTHYIPEAPVQKEQKVYSSETPLQEGQNGYALVTVWKKGWGAGPIRPVPLTKATRERVQKIKANIQAIASKGNTTAKKATSTIGNPINPSQVMPYKKTYMLKPGQALKIYDIKLTLKGIGEKSAKFVANALGQGNTINAQVGEPFKLEENMSARVLGANMRIDLLGITSESICAETYPVQCTTKKILKIGVSKLLFEKQNKIGRAVRNSIVSQEAKKTLVEEATAVGTTEIQPIEIPPMPFRVFELGEGEAASVGDFEIKVNAIWEDTAELVVKEKSTGLKFNYTIGKGWNLFSLPGEIRTSGKSDCHSSNFRLFEYVAGEKRFKKVIRPLPGEAYWLYNPGEACTVATELVKPVSLFELEELHKGWNFVPVVKEMVGKSISEMGNCKLKGAFFYDSVNSTWVKALDTKISEHDLGKSLAVFSQEKCSLVNPNTPIPEIPELPEVE